MMYDVLSFCELLLVILFAMIQMEIDEPQKSFGLFQKTMNG